MRQCSTYAKFSLNANAFQSLLNAFTPVYSASACVAWRFKFHFSAWMLAPPQFIVALTLVAVNSWYVHRAVRRLYGSLFFFEFQLRNGYKNNNNNSINCFYWVQMKFISTIQWKKVSILSIYIFCQVFLLFYYRLCFAIVYI